MRKFNLYYIISTVTLVFMLFMFYETLQLSGWFEEESLAEQLYRVAPGDYRLSGLNSNDSLAHRIKIIDQPGPRTPGELSIALDSVAWLQIKLSDFEDDQVLVELFCRDSSGVYQRLEGCELLFTDNDSGKIAGSTIGDFCGLNAASTEYLVLQLQLEEPKILLQIETRRLDDQGLLNRDEYLLERLDPR